MIRLTNYAKIAFRILLRDRFYSAVNLAGLALGMAACLLIALYVADEYAYDRAYAKADRIYRLVTPAGGHLAPPLGPLLRDLPEVAQVVRTSIGNRSLMIHGDQRDYENVLFVDGNFFALFDLPFVYGDPATALMAPHKLVISTQIAAKYFGDRDPRGEVFSWDGLTDYEITGVVELPTHTHFPFEKYQILGSMATWESHFADNWPHTFVHYNHFIYLLLGADADPAGIPAKAFDLVGRAPEDYQRRVEGWGGFELQPLADIHLHSRLPLELGTNGRAEHVYIAVAIAALVLVVASINYVNLSLARGARRASEIGIRKAVGAGRGQLVGQLLAESALVCLLALLAALFAVEAALPDFNAFFGKDLSLGDRGGALLLVALGAALLVGVLSGTYPALVISSWQPLRGLRGRVTRWQGVWRQPLLVFQFAVSIGLVALTGTVYDQLHYLDSKELGYDKDRVLLLAHGLPGLNARVPALQQALRQHHGVEATASFGRAPSTELTENGFLRRPGDATVAMAYLNVEPGFFGFFDMAVVAGRVLDPAISTDHNDALVINESALPALGFASAAAAVGSRIDYDSRTGGGRGPATVVGVVADVHFESLHSPIKPMFFFYAPGDYRFRYTGVKIKAGRIRETVELVERIWADMIPVFPLEHRFLDVDFHRLYHGERRLGQMLVLCAGLALAIACIGALALALFAAERRTKEIGVRKIMGATRHQIVALLALSFTWPVVIATAVACPAAYFGARAWLQGFAYRTEPEPALFAASAAAVLALVWLTVGYQALRAAGANPVEALRHE